ncbi:hypothetical protein HAX54_004374, partial [Datura stramonium]|nr:hypothetical protein [Datura stramonium]
MGWIQKKYYRRLLLMDGKDESYYLRMSYPDRSCIGNLKTCLGSLKSTKGINGSYVLTTSYCMSQNSRK